MDLYPNGRGLAVWLGVVCLLVVVHVFASGGTFTIRSTTLNAVAITPETTLSRWWNHVVAGFFHTTPIHLAFNVALFSLAFPFAIRGQSLWATLASAYAVSLFGVLLLHLAVVRPLAAAGLPYAVQAMTIPLVGFSVVAYATAGMAVAGIASPLLALGLGATVVVFEAAAGLGGFTGPFIFVYHLTGFLAGLGPRGFAIIPRVAP
ncbi:MAG: hypothetical protein V4510_07095 [bacterium]